MTLKGMDPSKPVLGTHELDVTDISLLLVPCFHYSYFVGCAVGQIGGNIQKSTRLQTTDVSYSLGPRVGVRIPLGEAFAVQGFGEVLFVPDPIGIVFPDLNAVWDQPVASAFFGATFSMKIE